jgi:trimeric autotransporter adhesin
VQSLLGLHRVAAYPRGFCEKHNMAQSKRTAPYRREVHRYDSLNRVVTSKGQLQNGVIVRGSTGTDMVYTASGQRAWSESGSQRETYVYDDAGRMKQVFIGAAGVSVNINSPATSGAYKLADFSYDLSGRQTQQKDYASNGSVSYQKDTLYNAKGQLESDATITKQGSDTLRANTTYTYGTGNNYALGSVITVSSSSQKNGTGAWTTSLTTNVYGAIDGRQEQTTHQPNTSQSQTNTTTFAYEIAGGQSQLKSAQINDGRARSVTYSNDLNGQVLRRDESDRNTSAGDPHEIWYRFGGKEMGYVGNNGTTDVDYAASIAQRTAAAPTGTQGAFRNGATTGASYSDFDQSYNPINSYEQGYILVGLHLRRPCGWLCCPQRRHPSWHCGGPLWRQQSLVQDRRNQRPVGQ